MTDKTLQTKCLMPFWAVCVCALSLQAGCSGRETASPDGYDLNKPQSVELGKVLNEISGIAWDNKSNTIVAISDSKEKIVEINLRKGKLRDRTGAVIPKDSDTEDLVLTDSAYYLLSSWGELRQVPLDARDTGTTRYFNMNLPDKNDFESLYYDPTAKGLVLLCKSCAMDKGRKVRSAFRFDPVLQQFDSLPLFSISNEKIRTLLKDNDAEFDPSAAALHPINKRLFILSSAGQLLVVTDNRGAVIEAYKLNPDKYPQAEGIAFAPNGDMYISNEGKYGKATLYFFPYKHKGKKQNKE